MSYKFIPGPPDANLVLQAAVTKTANFDGPWLDMGKGFAPGGLGMPAAAVVNVTAFDLTSSNETYSYVLQIADDDGSGAADAATVRNAGATLAVSAVGLQVVKGLLDGQYARLSLTVSGTTPSITYSGNLSPG